MQGLQQRRRQSVSGAPESVYPMISTKLMLPIRWQEHNRGAVQSGVGQEITLHLPSQSIRKIYCRSNETGEGMKYYLAFFLLVAALVTAGCTGGNQNPPVTPTPQIIYITVTPTATTVTPVPTATPPPPDPVLGKKWRLNYDFGDPDNPWSYYRNESMVFTMDSAGKTNGTITSESGASATITGKWYMDPETGIYYITPVSCMSLDTNWGEVLTVAGERVKWDPSAPDIPGKNNPYHWCEDNGVIYEMKYMPPNTLVEMDYSNTRTKFGGITFTAA